MIKKINSKTVYLTLLLAMAVIVFRSDYFSSFYTRYGFILIIFFVICSVICFVSFVCKVVQAIKQKEALIDILDIFFILFGVFISSYSVVFDNYFDRDFGCVVAAIFLIAHIIVRLISE